jgi:ferric-dicitrate binding protein FerR (iron transport regulator)
MKNDDQGAEALLRQMGRLVVPLVTPEHEASRQERMASSVNRLLQRLRAEPPPRRLPLRALGGFVAVAASLALLFGARHLVRPPQPPAVGEVAHVVSVSGESTLLRVGSSPSPVFAEQRVDATDELRTTRGARAELALTGAGKARVDISEDTRVRLNQRLAGTDAASEDWLELEQGLVTLRVAKLPPGLGLSVQTPDARVTVHGTRFSVRVSPRAPSGTVTFVAVTEGRVEVDSRGQAVFLGPGDHWSSQTSAPEPEAAPVSLPDPHANARAGAAPPVTTSLARPPTSARAARVSESTLAEENRLYAQALTHAGAGELSPALADLATLIERYPGSPLAQNARVERFRLLQQSGNVAAAAQEARRYLSEYPSGFARGEAQRLALLGLETPE